MTNLQTNPNYVNGIQSCKVFLEPIEIYLQTLKDNPEGFLDYWQSKISTPLDTCLDSALNTGRISNEERRDAEEVLNTINTLKKTIGGVNINGLEGKLNDLFSKDISTARLIAMYEPIRGKQ